MWELEFKLKAWRFSSCKSVLATASLSKLKQPSNHTRKNRGGQAFRVVIFATALLLGKSRPKIYICKNSHKSSYFPARNTIYHEKVLHSYRLRSSTGDKLTVCKCSSLNIRTQTLRVKGRNGLRRWLIHGLLLAMTREAFAPSTSTTKPV